MQNLIEANTPEEQATAINAILNNTNAAIASVLVSRDLLLEKANQLRNHELIGADTTYLGHVKFSDDVEVDPENNQMKIRRTIIQTEVAFHDVDTNSHGDVREKLEEIPKTVSAPLVSGPGTVRTGANAIFEISAQSLLPNSYIQRINVHMPDGTTVSRSGANVVNGVASFTLVFTGEDLSTKQFRIQAFDNFGSPSEFVTHSIIISTNTPPVVTDLICQDLPLILEPGKVYPFRLVGGVDEDGDLLTYSIVKPGASPLVFSQMSNITDTTELTVRLDGVATRGIDYSFTVTGTDERFMGTASKVFTIKSNTLPDVSGMSSNVPYYLNPSTTYEVSFSGATDIDGSALVFDISSDKDIEFDMTSGISMNQVFGFTTPSTLVPGEDVVFTLTVKDTDTGVSTRSFTHKVNTPPNVDACVYEIDTVMAPDSSNTIKISGGVDSEDHPITYRLNTNCPYASFSKELGVLNDEEVVFTIENADGVRGNSYEIYIRAMDSFGGFVDVVKSFSINELINVSAVVVNGLPAIIKPNHTISCHIDGATEVDATQDIRYSIVSSDPKITFSKATDLAAGESFDMIVGDVDRGTDVVFEIVASDGLEIVTVPDKTVSVNILPDVSGLTHNVPIRMYPGQTVSVNISGIVDTTLSGNLSISLETNSSDIVFAKTSGIAVGENVSLSCAGGANRGAITIVSIIITDGIETVESSVTVAINRLPEVTNLVLSGLPPFIASDMSYQLSLSGATDPDSQNLTYSISSNVPGAIDYSKSSELVNGESFTMYTDSLTQNTTVNLTINVTDGLETVSKNFSTVVNSLPISANLELVLPAILKPNTTYENIVVFGASDVDTPAQSLKYSIGCDLPGITFSKSSALDANESFSVIIDDTVVRGDTASFTVTVSDGVETSNRVFNKKINRLPVATGIVVNGLPVIIQPNASYPVTLTGATEADAGQTLVYSIESDDPNVTFSKFSGIAAGETFNVVVNSEVVRGSSPTFTVTVSDGLETSEKELTVTTVNVLPVVDSVSMNGIPAVVKPNSIHPVTLANATDADGQTLTYSIVSSDPKVTFSKTANIAAGESFNVVVSSTITRNTTPTFTITVSDGLETSSKTITPMRVNRLPVSTGVDIDSLPGIIKPGTTYPVTLIGATEADAGQTLVYSIVSSDPKITFSKSTGLAAGESFNVIVDGTITRGTIPTLTVTVSDGLESVNKVFSKKINTKPVSTDVVLENLPEFLKPNTTYPVIVSGATEVDTEQNIQYSISVDNANITFSKATGLAENESFNIIVGSGIVRGATPTITVTASDGLETTSKAITTKVNRLPVATNVVMNSIPAIVKPNSTHAVTLTGATEADGGQTLVYSIVSSDPKITFSKATGLAAGESFNVIVDGTITRGTIPTFTVTVSDSLETATKTLTPTKINQLPVATAVVMNGMPTRVLPTSTHAVTLTGATEADAGQTLVYSITSDNAAFTFSKSTGLAAGESFNVIATSATRGVTPTFTVTVSDGVEVATKTLTPTKVNSLPVATNTVINGLPTKPVGGVAYTINFTGATDADAQALKYDIQSGYTGLTFSKTADIAAGENITVTATKVSALTNRTFNVKAEDTLGELSVDKALTIAVDPIVKTSAPTITYPTNGAEIPAVGAGESYSITLSAYATYVEV